MVECRNDITHRTRKLGTSFLFFRNLLSEKRDLSYILKDTKMKVPIFVHITC